MSSLKALLLFLLKLLPDDPIGPFINRFRLDEFNILGYLNWFIPFDSMTEIMGMWLLCMGSYRIYRLVKSHVDKKL